ncbi:MAG: rod shape-determining protein MreC, partial [Deltaproteobacteria bacterium]
DRRAAREGGRDHSWWSGLILEIVVPLQKVVATPVHLLRDGWSHYLALLHVREENDQLRGKIAALRETNLQLREALVASGRLQRIVAMREGFETPMLPSEVVGQDVSPWFRSLLLDRGRAHAVRAGMPVITDQGVVGLVTATSEHAAKTMLLLDRQSAIDGIVQRSRARGIVHGTGTDRLDFEFVIRGADVRPGDVVITSGLGGVYPKGLRIGEVIGVSEVGEVDLLQTATLKAAVDVGRLEQVFVMLWRGPTMDLLYGSQDSPSARSDAGEREAPAS